jgi:hypothetical protein
LPIRSRIGRARESPRYPISLSGFPASKFIDCRCSHLQQELTNNFEQQATFWFRSVSVLRCRAFASALSTRLPRGPTRGVSAAGASYSADED